MIGNLQVYRQLGYRVVCICRWSPRLIDLLEGALVLNIVPGSALPAPQALPAFEQATLAASVSRPASSRWLAKFLRAKALAFLGAGLQLLLRPRLLHQRANQRLMLRSCDSAATHIIELNDEYVPDLPCDGYLSVDPRPALTVPQFVSRWPVPEVAQFDEPRFLQRLACLARPARRLNVLLFGIGGTITPLAVHRFIASHAWFLGAEFDLHIYGGTASVQEIDGVVQHSWSDPDRLDVHNFDAAVLYYEPLVYDDGRLRLGSPTKLWKYVDWSLPVFCNRSYVSEHFLGNFDTNREVLIDKNCARMYAKYLLERRCKTLPVTYANSLAAFLTGLNPVSQ